MTGVQTCALPIYETPQDLRDHLNGGVPSVTPGNLPNDAFDEELEALLDLANQAFSEQLQRSGLAGEEEATVLTS